MSVRLECGDCLDVMLEMAAAEAQFDALISDPPYHLTSVVKRFGSASAAPAQHGTDGLYARQSAGFMGKQWDGGDIAFRPETWRLAYDVLKPGAHLLAFGGTRTFHRMAVAIEDAGFELRDTLMWVYGTGFPKSHDVSKGVDARLGAKGSRGAPKLLPNGKEHHFNIGFGEGDGYESAASDRFAYVPATPEAAAWAGWGTALKPAWEPIIMARKPLIGTVAANVLQFGTGALNIDASRIGADDGQNRPRPPRTPNEILGGGRGANLTASPHNAAGRWPANVTHDGSDEVLAAFAAYGESKSPTKGGCATPRKIGSSTDIHGTRSTAAHGDSGTAARFFYSAKASAADRAGSKHPTVKPLALMRYLCRMVTPPGGTILDPFAGSGTTLQAAAECGFNAVGVEREAEYQADILRRIAALDLAELAELCA